MGDIKRKCSVVVGIYLKEGKILMGRRCEAESRFANFWEFPGGKIEQGESDAEALHREFAEEIGCKITEMKHFHSFEWDYPDRIMDLRFYLIRLDCDSIEKMDLNAHSVLKWFRIEDALTEEVLPANKQILEKLLNHDN